VTPIPTGTHLITIQARLPSAQLAYQVTQGVIDSYKERNSNQQLDQSGLAISFYQSQLQNAEDDLNKANQVLSQYAVAMGYAPTGDGSDPQAASTTSAIAFDPKYAELQGNAHFAQQQVDDSRSLLQASQTNSAAAIQGADIGFNVIDEPQLPTAP